MKKKRGFTLVELLVVIAIIALLMSIMMPALGKARKLAQNVVCLNNLKNWGLFWQMYLNANESYFPVGYTGNVDDSGRWWKVLLPYYEGN